MKISAQVKLLPASAHDADALVATLRACNRAANHASEVAFAKDLKRRNVLQREVYHGRLKHIPFVCSAEALKLLASRKGESDLVMRDGMFFLIATIDIPEPEPFEPEGFLGVDLGIVNIATTSDGEIMAGRRLNRYRKRHRDLRTKLQKKRTKSAKRPLKRIRRREARYAADTKSCHRQETRCHR